MKAQFACARKETYEQAIKYAKKEETESKTERNSEYIICKTGYRIQ